MPLCFVSIGSNVEREENIRAALRALRDRFGPLLVSSVYETQAVGFTGDPFFNLVVAFVSDAPIETLHAFLLGIENARGRTKEGPRFAPRPLDLDILLYGELVRHDRIEVPRREIVEQAFVLEPLAEIAPDLMHPLEHRHYADMWNMLAPTAQGGRRVPIGLPD